MSQARAREELVTFLDSIRRPQMPVNAIADEESLVESGLIDSFAVLEIMVYLETNYSIDFAANGFDPAELSSISEILNLIEQRAL